VECYREEWNVTEQSGMLQSRVECYREELNVTEQSGISVLPNGPQSNTEGHPQSKCS
jgi:hypothetical protein